MHLIHLKICTVQHVVDRAINLSVAILLIKLDETHGQSVGDIS